MSLPVFILFCNTFPCQLGHDAAKGKAASLEKLDHPALLPVRRGMVVEAGESPLEERAQQFGFIVSRPRLVQCPCGSDDQGDE